MPFLSVETVTNGAYFAAKSQRTQYIAAIPVIAVQSNRSVSRYSACAAENCGGTGLFLAQIALVIDDKPWCTFSFAGGHVPSLFDECLWTLAAHVYNADH